MQSKRRVEPLDTFELDVPTTAADNAALWRARDHTAMDPHEYLDFLVRFTKDRPASRETNSDTDEPFEL